jgi:hypothetical protein
MTITEQQFNDILMRIDQLVDELSKKVTRSRLEVNEYCLELARQVDILTETELLNAEMNGKSTQIDELNECRKKWLKEIQDYEMDCRKCMETSLDKLLDSFATAKEWAKSVANNSRLFGLYSTQLTEQADKRITQLAAINLQMNGFQFGGVLMTFKEKEACAFNPTVSVFQKKRLTIPSLIQPELKDRLKAAFPDSSKYALSSGTS